jgi:hypothetical protein
VEREVIWVAWEGPGLEHLYLTLREEGPMAEGLVIGLQEDRPFRAAYEIRCDAQWRVREVRVGVLSSDWSSIDLLADGEGSWTTRAGDSVPGLKGCVDVDISATPTTNTLPIRRLGLRRGESAELVVAYVHVPQLRVGRERQRYGCLEASANGGIYRFEALPSGFAADIPVDADGLVVDYPGLFRRAWSG